MRPIEMEHTENAWDLKPAAMPVRSSTAKNMRGSGAAGSLPVDGYFLQSLVRVRLLCPDNGYNHNENTLMAATR